MTNGSFQKYNFGLKFESSLNENENEDGSQILLEAPLTGMHKSM